MEDRIRYLDITKGFAIILVIFGHTLYRTGFTLTIPFIKWIYSFHVPFFFIVSGILLGKKNINQKKIEFNFKSKLKSLILPYFILSFINILFICVQTAFTNGSVKGIFIEYFKFVFNFEGVYGTWFLPILFSGILLFTILYNAFSGKMFLISIGLYLFVFLFRDPSLVVIFRIFLALFYISIGFFSVKYTDKKKISWFLIFTLLILGAIYSKFLGMTMFKNIILKDPFLYLFTSLLTSYGFILLFMKTSSWKYCSRVMKVLEYFGRNSLIFFTTHMCLIMIIAPFYHNFVIGFSSFFAKPMVYGSILTLCILTIESLIVFLVNLIKKKVFNYEKR